MDLIREGSITAAAIRGRYYRDLSASSFHKTFKRDRDALETEGIHLVEKTQGVSKTWALDGSATFADVSALCGDGGTGQAEGLARVVGTMLRPLTGNGTPEATALGHAIARMALSTCAGPSQPQLRPLACDPDVLQAVSDGIATRHPVRLAYQSLSDEAPEERVVRGWGTFQLNGSVYLVCERTRAGSTDAVRTYNLSRATAAVTLSDEPPYQIPRDFSVADWVLLPFEIGEDNVEASLYVPRAQAPAFARAVRRRGETERHRGGSMVWRGLVRDLGRAASWAVEMGAIPLGPAALVDDWKGLLSRTTEPDVADGGEGR